MMDAETKPVIQSEQGYDVVIELREAHNEKNHVIAALRSINKRIERLKKLKTQG